MKQEKGLRNRSPSIPLGRFYWR